MRIEEMIAMLQDWERKHGPDAQIAIPRSSHEREVAAKAGIEDPQFGEEEFIYSGNIATYLDSRGPEIDW